MSNNRSRNSSRVGRACPPVEREQTTQPGSSHIGAEVPHHMPPAELAHRSSSVRLAEQFDETGRQADRIVRRNHETALTLPDGLRCAAGVPDDDRQTAGRRLQRRQTQTLGVQTTQLDPHRQGERVGRPEEAPDAIPAQSAGEGDRVCDANPPGQRRQRASSRTVTDDDELGAADATANGRPGIAMVGQAIEMMIGNE